MSSILRDLILLLVISAFASSLRADVGNVDGANLMLYWMIDDSNEIEFQYAVVYATEADLSERVWTTDNGYGVDAIALPKGIDGGFAYETREGSHLATLDILTELGSENWTSYNFYIELLQWDDVGGREIRVGVSATSSYDDLVSNNHVLGSGLTIPSNLVVWAPQTSTVPEPTSGVLLLLGAGCLILRRRNGHD